MYSGLFFYGNGMQLTVFILYQIILFLCFFIYLYKKGHNWNYMKKTDFLLRVSCLLFIGSITSFFLFTWWENTTLKDISAVLFFVSTIYSVEYVWKQTENTRTQISESLYGKIIIYTGVICLSFWLSSIVSTDLEMRTKVSSSLFGSFEILATAFLTMVSIVFIIQFVSGFLAIYFLFKFVKVKRRFFFTTYMTISLAALFATLQIVGKTLVEETLPRLLNDNFVNHVYHDNLSLDNFRICFNLPKEAQILLLPSGDVSVVKKNTTGKFEYSISKCSR